MIQILITHLKQRIAGIAKAHGINEKDVTICYDKTRGFYYTAKVGANTINRDIQL